MTALTTLAECWLKALLTLVALALSANVIVGPSVRWRPVFVSGILVAIVICEYYYLFFAMVKVPRDWASRRGVSIERWDCLQSTKGGKRADGSGSSFDINPCFCPFGAFCKNLTSGEWVDPSVCPKDGTALCWDINHTPVDLYMKSTRDCTGAQGPSCSLDAPCTPCGLDTLEGYIKASGGDANSNNATDGVSRCRSCGAGNSGACSFVLGEGPYCWKEPGSREVEPCSVCCTQPEALYLNGTCY
ncbi:unnamed protein product [Ectocarpus sp. 12 AP-2014]